jgi:hypothetical protein
MFFTAPFPTAGIGFCRAVVGALVTLDGALIRCKGNEATRATATADNLIRAPTCVEQTSNIFHVGSTSERADCCRVVPVCSGWCRESPAKWWAL